MVFIFNGFLYFFILCIFKIYLNGIYLFMYLFKCYLFICSIYLVKCYLFIYLFSESVSQLVSE